MKLTLWMLAGALALCPAAVAQTCHDGTASGTQPCAATLTENFDKGVLNPKLWSNSYTDGSTWATDRPVWAPDTFDFIPGGGLRMRVDGRVTSFPNGIPGQCTANCTKLYTGSSITTHGSFYQAYGYYEVSAQLYPGPGVFPAFWLWGQGLTAPTTHPEIDIFEFNTTYLDETWFNNSHVAVGTHSFDSKLATFDPSAAYHRYGMAWLPSQLSFYVDDVLQWTQTNAAVPNDAMYLLLDADLGGPGGAPTAGTVFPQYMNVGYVHVFQYQGMPAANPMTWTWGKTTVSPQTANPGDTVTFNSTVINGATPVSGTVAGMGPHINVALTNYLNQTQYIPQTASAFNMPHPLAANEVAPISYTYTIPTTMAPGVYGLKWTVSTTPSLGSSVYSDQASARVTVVSQSVLNLSSLSFVPAPGKPYSGSVTYGTSGKAITLQGNMWQTAPFVYNIVPATMLEFDFSASDGADDYNIGLFPGSDYGSTTSQKYLFQFAGGRQLGVQSFRHYLNADGSTHYFIPVGNYYQGTSAHLTLLSTSSTGVANATFSNIRFYELTTTEQ